MKKFLLVIFACIAMAAQAQDNAPALKFGYLSYDLSKLPDVEVWYANYDSVSPDFAYQIRMWQYTDSGTLQGVNGKVDYNLYFLEQEPEEEKTSA